MRIAILSCFYPYRGGISQFNACLLGELGRFHTVKAFNFSRQYPEFLFPGKTQYVTPQDEAVPVESESLLDTANPFSWAGTAKAIRAWKPDILIVRYWMSYFGPSLGYVARHMDPACKVIAILDNVIPHEPHFFDKPLTKYFLGGVDGCITMCGEVEQDLLRLKPEMSHTVQPHPVYSHFGERVAREDAERKLGLEPARRNILFFGLIRKYKGLDILLEAFKTLGDEYQLIIAGEPYGDFGEYQELIDSCPGKDRIHVFPDYIRDSEVKDYFCAADLAVLPYRSATQSGISAISYHFELPMIVTDVGGLKETIGDRGTGIVAQRPDPECIAAEIAAYFGDPSKGEKCRECIRSEKERLSWQKFCKDLIIFADSIRK